MAMLDRLKEATRPANTIEGVQQPEPARRVPDLHGASPSPVSEGPQAPAKKATSDAKAPAYTTEPEAIAKAYYVENRGNERRYFDDYQRKALAIRADDTTINSKREDLNTIRAMLTMAEARGWSEVKVSGSADFKRETWIEASARGITAQGYKAGDLDRQEADRRRAERGQELPRTTPAPGTNEVRQAAAPTSPTPAPTPAPKLSETPSTPALTPSTPTLEPRAALKDPEYQAAQKAFAQARDGITFLEESVKMRNSKPEELRYADNVKFNDVRVKRDLDNIFKQPALASSLASQKVTPDGLKGDLDDGRFDKVASVLAKAVDAVYDKRIEKLAEESKSPKPPAPGQQSPKAEGITRQEPTPAVPAVDHRKELTIATAALSPDGRVILGALSEKIDRQMNKLNSEAKAEMKAYVATELVKKEKAEGPVVLSAELKRVATAPEAAPQLKTTTEPKAPTQPEQQAPRRSEPEEPRRTRGR